MFGLCSMAIQGKKKKQGKKRENTTFNTFGNTINQMQCHKKAVPSVPPAKKNASSLKKKKREKKN